MSLDEHFYWVYVFYKQNGHWQAWHQSKFCPESLCMHVEGNIMMTLFKEYFGLIVWILEDVIVPKYDPCTIMDSRSRCSYLKWYILCLDFKGNLCMWIEKLRLKSMSSNDTHLKYNGRHVKVHVFQLCDIWRRKFIVIWSIMEHVNFRYEPYTMKRVNLIKFTYNALILLKNKTYMLDVC